ncbi:MAG: DMT family transporter [Sphingomicrobium sp.]
MARDFESNLRDADGAETRQPSPVIDRTMGRRQWAVLLLLGLIWGGSFFLIKVAVTHVPTFSYVWLRVAIAAAALLLFLRVRGTALGIPRGAWGMMLILSLLNNVVPFLLFGWASTQGPSGLVSILNATTPIWGVLLAHAFTSDERLSAARLLGVLLGFGGVATMIVPALIGSGGMGLLAQTACLVGAFSYAVAGVFSRRFKALNISPMSVTAGQLAMSALLLLPVMLLFDQPWHAALPPLSAIGAILTISLVCTAFAYVLYFRLIETSGASNALLVPILTPPIAILLGGLFLGEALHAGDFAGLGLIALGLAAIDGRCFILLAKARLRSAA